MALSLKHTMYPIHLKIPWPYCLWVNVNAFSQTCWCWWRDQHEVWLPNFHLHAEYIFAFAAGAVLLTAYITLGNIMDCMLATVQADKPGQPPDPPALTECPFNTDPAPLLWVLNFSELQENWKTSRMNRYLHLHSPTAAASSQLSLFFPFPVFAEPSERRLQASWRFASSCLSTYDLIRKASNVASCNRHHS